MTFPATHLTDPQGWQPWMAPVPTGGQAGSRVWGRDLPGEVPSGRKSGPSQGSCWASTFAYGELASDLLTHMNGRVYDYRLGRFLSVDPIISNPLSSQAINPYSYIGNNPLSGTDPTGYCAEGTEAESGSRICRQQDPVTQIKNQIGDALSKGVITVKTSFDDAQKALGDGFSKLVDKASSMFGIKSGADVAGPASSTPSDPARVHAPGTEQAATVPLSPVVTGGRLTSSFGNRTMTADDGTLVTRFHNGLDAGPLVPGQLDPVLAPFNGTVTEGAPQLTIGGEIRSLVFRAAIPESWQVSLDLAATIRHVNPDVAAGQVTAGQVVGRLATPQSQGSYYAPSGALAPFSTGPHGHLELRLNGQVIDPARVFGPTLNRSGTFELSRDAFFRPLP